MSSWWRCRVVGSIQSPEASRAARGRNGESSPSSNTEGSPLGQTVGVAEREMQRTWPAVRFHARDEPILQSALIERIERVYERQAADTVRFDRAADDLLARLDPDLDALVAMTCDRRFGPLFVNWAASCDRSDIDVRSKTVVFPTDAATRDRIEAIGFATYFDEESDALRDMSDSGEYGDLEWTEYMYHQNWVIGRLLTVGVDVLFQDVDVVWRHDPRPELAQRADAGVDVQTMYDGPNPRFQPLYANTGFMYLRDTQATRAFWREVYAHHDMVGYYRSQQEAINVVLAAHAHRGLSVHVLDDDRFANGFRYCGGRTAPADPSVVHHSWTRDLEEKLVRYESHGHWFIDSSRAADIWPSFRSVALGGEVMQLDRLRAELADRLPDMSYPPLHGHHVEMDGTCGLGHRLVRNAQIFHAARAAGYRVRVDWFPWTDLFADTDELFGTPIDTAPAFRFGNESSEIGEVDHSRSKPPITLYRDMDIAESVGFSVAGCAEEARWRKEVVGPAAADHTIDFHHRLLTQLRPAWSARIDRFLAEVVGERRLIALHLRTGNGETGDFVDKSRGVDSVDIVRRFAGELDRQPTSHAVVFAASDSPDTVALVREMTDVEVCSFADALPPSGHVTGDWVAPNSSGDVVEQSRSERIEATFQAYADLVLLGAADQLFIGAWTSFAAGSVAMNRRRADLGTRLSIFDTNVRAWLRL